MAHPGMLRVARLAAATLVASAAWPALAQSTPPTEPQASPGAATGPAAAQPPTAQPPIAQPLAPQPPPLAADTKLPAGVAPTAPAPAEPGAATHDPGATRDPGAHPLPHRAHGEGPPCGPCGGSHEHRRPLFGGLGYVAAGMMTGGFSSMQSTLAQPSAIGAGYDAAPAGLVFGGGGGGLYRRLWVGGKGFGLAVDTVNTSHGTTSLSGGGGGFELGYAVIASEEWLVVPFFGGGGFGYSLKVQNTNTKPLSFASGDPIPVDGQTKYTAGFLTGEIGIRASRLIFWGDGGLMVGAEIGYLSALQRAAWESSSGVAPAEGADLRGGYFRLLIGGGGFSFRARGGGEHEHRD